MEKKTKYVLGFMFDQKSYGVLLILKNKPEWQKGFFNGIGGKIEGDEGSLKAMVREFKEETGIYHTVWTPVILMEDIDFSVQVFTTKTDSIHDFKTIEEEKVCYIPLDELKDFKMLSNLDWLIPMCLDIRNITYKVNN